MFNNKQTSVNLSLIADEYFNIFLGEKNEKEITLNCSYGCTFCMPICNKHKRHRAYKLL